MRLISLSSAENPNNKIWFNVDNINAYTIGNNPNETMIWLNNERIFILISPEKLTNILIDKPDFINYPTKDERRKYYNDIV